MRVVFMGTPDFSVGTLRELAKAGHEIAGVISQPDKPKGRGKNLQPTTGQRGGDGTGTSGISAPKSKRSGIYSGDERTESGCDRCGGVRTDYSERDSAYAKIWMY